MSISQFGDSEKMCGYCETIDNWHTDSTDLIYPVCAIIYPQEKKLP